MEWDGVIGGLMSINIRSILYTNDKGGKRGRENFFLFEGTIGGAYSFTIVEAKSKERMNDHTTFTRPIKFTPPNIWSE